MSGSEGEDEDETPSPIKPTSLKRFLKDQKEIRAGGDAIEALQLNLEWLAERLWLEAAWHAEEDGRKTVMERDIQYAIDELTEPHDLIKQTSEQLDWMKRYMDGQVEQSLLYAEKRYGD